MVSENSLDPGEKRQTFREGLLAAASSLIFGVDDVELEVLVVSEGRPLGV